MNPAGRQARFARSKEFENITALQRCGAVLLSLFIAVNIKNISPYCCIP